MEKYRSRLNDMCFALFKKSFCIARHLNKRRELEIGFVPERLH